MRHLEVSFTVHYIKDNIVLILREIILLLENFFFNSTQLSCCFYKKINLLKLHFEMEILIAENKIASRLDLFIFGYFLRHPQRLKISIDDVVNLHKYLFLT